MAAEHDGSITIDTKLDTQGFERGSGELKRAVQSLAGQVNQTGGQLQNAFKFDFGTPKQVVNTFARALKQVNAEIKDLGAEGQAALEGDADALARFREGSSETLDKLAEMRAELEAFGETEFETEEHKAASKKYQDAATRVEELRAALEAAEDAEAAMEAQFHQSDAYKQAAADLEKAKAQLEEYNRLKAMGNAGKSRIAQMYMENGWKAGEGPEGAVKRAEQALEALETKFANSKAYQAAGAKIEQLEMEIEEAMGTAANLQEEMESIPASFSGFDTVNYENDMAALQQCIDKLLEYRQLVREGVGNTDTAPSAEWDAVQAKWAGMVTLSGLVGSRIRAIFDGIASGAKTVGGWIGTGLLHPIQLVDRAFGAVASGATRAVSAAAGLVKTGITTALKKIADLGARAAKSLWSMASGAIRSGIQKLGSALLSVGKHSSKTNNSFSHGLKTMLRYGLGIRSLFVLFNKLRTALVNGLNALAETDSGFKYTIDSFKASLTTLRNSFASAVAPVAEIVLPILTRLINTLAEAISQVGMFIAALTGKSNFMKASAAQVGAADSTTKSSNAASKALDNETASAKELQRTLAGFDEIEKLNDNTNAGSSKAGTAAASPSFQSTPVDSAMGDFAKRFKEAWDASDFSWLGKALGEKLKAALEGIPWDKIKATMAKVATSIATFLNGFLSVPGLFTVIGQTLAQGINTAFTFVEAFVRTFDWSALGKAFHDALAGALDTIDWPLIYLTLVEIGSGIGTAVNTALSDPEIWNQLFTAISLGIGAAVSGLDAYITEIDWAAMGANLGNGLNTGVETFPWGKIAQTLTHAVNAAFALWYLFVTTFDFEKFGRKIGGAFSDAVKGINWTEGGASVAETINGLFEALNGFIDETDWGALGKAAIDAVGGFFENVDWSTYGEFFSLAMTALFDFLSSAIAEIDWTQLPDKIIAAISDFFSGYDWDTIATSAATLLGEAFGAIAAVGSALWEKMKSVGKQIINGGYRGITDKLASVGEWLKKCVFDPFIDGFKSIFGIESPSKEMQPLGEYIIEGFFGGIVDALGSVGEWIKEHILDPFVNAVKVAFGIEEGDPALLSIGSDILKGLLDGIVKVIDGIGGWLSRMVLTPIVDGFKSLFGIEEGDPALLSVGSDVLKGLLDGILSGVEGIASWIKTNVVDPVVQGFKDMFGLDGDTPLLFDIGSNLLEGIKDGLLGAMDGIGTWIDENVTGPICGFFKDLFGIASPSTVFAEYGGYLMEGLEGGVEDNTTTVTDAMSSAQEDMRAVFSDTSSWGKTGGNLLAFGLKVGIISKLPMLTEAAKKVETSMRTSFLENRAAWKSSGSTLADNIKQGLILKKNALTSYASEIADAMLAKFTDLNESFSSAGSTLMTSLSNGMIGAGATLVSGIGVIASNMQTTFNSLSWWTVGQNIAVGIYNGLIAHSNYLQVLAWNTAVGMFNAACNALRIASPSKEFAWIGQMITAGLGQGVEDHTDTAVSAVTSLAEAVTQEAENANPIMSIDTSISDMTGGLDTVLTAFSDKVVSSFSAMIAALDHIASGAGFVVPAVASGSVVPYASATGKQALSADDIRASVFEAVVNACESMAGQTTAAENEPPVINVYVGGKKMTDVVIDGINQVTARTGRCPIVI